jgi:hypothetical protein
LSTNPESAEEYAMFTTHLVFREATSSEELVPLLKLRSEAMRGSPTGHAYGKDTDPLEMDEFDLYSRHFGLWHVTEEGDIPAGYIRMVTTRRSPIAAIIAAISVISGSGIEKMAEGPRIAFPMLGYMPQTAQLRRRIDECQNRREYIMEASRHSLAPHLRNTRMIREFVTAVTASFLAHGVERAFLTCLPSHVVFYEKFGFGRVRGIEDALVEKFGMTMACLEGSPRTIPLGVIDMILKHKREFVATGEIRIEGYSSVPVPETAATRPPQILVAA